MGRFLPGACTESAAALSRTLFRLRPASGPGPHAKLVWESWNKKTDSRQRGQIVCRAVARSSHLAGKPASGGDAAGDIRGDGDEAPDRATLWSASRVGCAMCASCAMCANGAGRTRQGSGWRCEGETACQTRLSAPGLTRSSIRSVSLIAPVFCAIENVVSGCHRALTPTPAEDIHAITTHPFAHTQDQQAAILGN